MVPKYPEKYLKVKSKGLLSKVHCQPDACKSKISRKIEQQNINTSKSRYVPAFNISIKINTIIMK